MTEALTIIAVGFTAFVATNVDNLVILVALYARFQGREFFVTLGQMFTTVAVLFAAWMLGEAANVAPVEYVGLLGMVPLAIGIYWFYGLARGDTEGTVAEPTAQSSVVIVATVLSLAANSIDTLLTMAVVIADSKSEIDGLILGSALMATVLLSSVARFAVSNPRLGPLFERYSARVAPFIMIAVGLYVLANTSTDLLPD